MEVGENPKPPKTEKAANPETLFERGGVDFTETRFVDLHLERSGGDGEVLAVVDEEGEPRKDDLTLDDLYIDPDSAEILRRFYEEAGVQIRIKPWTTEEGEDFSGSCAIPLDSLNIAIQDKRLVLVEIKERRGDFVIEGLAEHIKKEEAELERNRPLY